MAKKWMITPAAPELSAASQAWGVPRLVAQLLLNRGVRPSDSPESFLAPKLQALIPPDTLPGAPEAAELIVQAIRAGKKIVLYGDYDVDGTTGIAILWHMLTRAGGRISFYVPHRVEEGYGVNAAAADRLIADGAELLVTVDCGISAVDVAERFKQAGVQLIITDHHAAGPRLPQADAIVHPALTDEYGNPDLCGAGVAFKLAWAVAQKQSGETRVGADARELLMELLPLAALGTIADVVPLTHENRIIARHGLERLPLTPFPGLQELIKHTGLDERRIQGYDVGFKLAPLINAAGRMGHARLAVELLTRATDQRAREITLYLEEHNRARKATERRILRQAIETIEDSNLACDARRAIVLASEGWHSGVIGIVAARLVDRFSRPVVLVAVENRIGQGSARSIKPFDIGAALAECQAHLLSHGGHKMAAGLRIEADRIDAFAEAFVGLANNRLTGRDLTPAVRLDAEVSLGDLSLPTVGLIESLGPFGHGNPKPRLATGWIELADEPRRVGGGGEHLQSVFRENGARMKAIGFGKGDAIEDLKQHRRCRVAFEPIINEFRGRRSVEMQIIDLRFPGDETVA